jgi:hypothetical protein
MTTQRVGGIAYITVDGDQIRVRGNTVVHLSQSRREGVAGQDGVQGYTEQPVVPGIELDVTAMPGYSIQGLAGITDSTITVECANGMVYVLRDAWQADLLDINTVEGSIKVHFQGMSCDEFAGSTVA